MCFASSLVIRFLNINSLISSKFFSLNFLTPSACFFCSVNFLLIYFNKVNVFYGISIHFLFEMFYYMVPCKSFPLIFLTFKALILKYGIHFERSSLMYCFLYAKCLLHSFFILNIFYFSISMASYLFSIFSLINSCPLLLSQALIYASYIFISLDVFSPSKTRLTISFCGTFWLNPKNLLLDSNKIEWKDLFMETFYVCRSPIMYLNNGYT
jgi:hypothetical protein